MARTELMLWLWWCEECAGLPSACDVCTVGMAVMDGVASATAVPNSTCDFRTWEDDTLQSFVGQYKGKILHWILADFGLLPVLPFTVLQAMRVCGGVSLV